MIHDYGKYADIEILEGFAGPGGWSTALQRMGKHSVAGIEWDSVACQTGWANGHIRIQADISQVSSCAWSWPSAKGGVFSPPCQGFSGAGKRVGIGDRETILKAVHMIRLGLDVPSVIAWLRRECKDERSALVLEPLRFVLDLGLEWTAWEQVPAVLPLWEACAEVLRDEGYNVWTGNLHAEQYGVPQTRKRAILIANRDYQVSQPIPTHSKYFPRDPTRLDEGVLPWVSMAEALSWGCTDRPAYTVTGGGTATGGAEPFGNGARKGLRAARESGRWLMGDVRSSKGTVRPAHAPAPTITASMDNGNFRWVPPDADSIRVSVTEAAILQSFPAGYVWTGSKTDQYRQVGDAVPPLLAEAILKAAGV